MEYLTPEQQKARNAANERVALEAWEHIKKTRAPSIAAETGACDYLGLGCAFSPALEGMTENINASAHEFFSTFGLQRYLKDWVKPASPEFCGHVQASHDTLGLLPRERRPTGTEFVHRFYKNLAEACKNFGVPAPRIDDVLVLKDYPDEYKG